MVDPLRERLASFGQSHLLSHYTQLAPDRQRALVRQIEALDLELLDRLAHRVESAQNWQELAARAVSPPAVSLAGGHPTIASRDADEAGRAALASGQVGAVLVAGGQGTRLGFPQPKGMFPIGPISQRTLFQVLSDQLRAVSRRFGTVIPLFVMTSPATHDETVAYWQGHQYCGLDPSDVHFFCQGTMPAVDAESGKILLAAPHALALSPDGHGGMLAAFVRSGGLREAQARGLRMLFYFQVDNPLAPVCDPPLLGYHTLTGSEMSTQVVRKSDPLERVGNVVSDGNHLFIIEYSDLPEEAARRRLADGSLALWAGNTAVHVLDIEFLERAERQQSLPFHRARKIVPYIDEAGRWIEPAQPNAIKYERFIFDLLPHARNGLVVEVSAHEAFAPVKNGEGSRDTPHTARQAMIEQHRRWLQEAGATVAANVAVEIHPLFALDAQELRSRIALPMHITQPRYFPPAEEISPVGT